MVFKGSCEIMPWLKQFLRKFRGVEGAEPPATKAIPETLWSGLSSLGAMCVLTLVHESYGLTSNDRFLLTGSFGASAVLVFDAFASPLAQPQNVILGHVVSAVVGVSVSKIFGENMLWLSQSLAVALSITVMGLVNCMHPPGGATALLAVIGSQELRDMGYAFILYPTLSGAILMVTCGLFTNNLLSTRHYPQYWCPSWLRKSKKKEAKRESETENGASSNGETRDGYNTHPGTNGDEHLETGSTKEAQSSARVELA